MIFSLYFNPKFDIVKSNIRLSPSILLHKNRCSTNDVDVLLEETTI